MPWKNHSPAPRRVEPVKRNDRIAPRIGALFAVSLSFALLGAPASGLSDHAKNGDAPPAHFFPIGPAPAPPGPATQAHRPWTVFEIVAEADRLGRAPLWPGFEPREVPAALYDGRATYLFNYPGAPRGFHRKSSPIEHLVYRGIHPAVIGNRRAQIDGRWVATCVPRIIGDGAAEPAGLETLASVLIHEKFHVYQAWRGFDWKPNDAVLLLYPPDSADSLALRRMELLGAQRAVESAAAPAAAGWARSALSARARRLAGLPREYAVYERKLMLLEGLAEYVQLKARGLAPERSGRAWGIAPAAVRELGYIEGAALAFLLDRFRPGWKTEIEAAADASLPDLLGEAIDAAAAPKGGPAAPGGPGAAEDGFTEAERETIRRDAALDLAADTEAARRAIREFLDRDGYRIEIEARGAPFRYVLFDPFSIFAPDARSVFHASWMSGRLGGGEISVSGRPCLAERDASGEVRRLILTGFAKAPAPLISRFRGGAAMSGSIRFSHEGLSLSLERATFLRRGWTVIIRVG